MGLGYPGGPAIEKAARDGDPGAVDLPRPDTDEGFEFSFAGLKTALVRVVEPDGVENCGFSVADLAASFQQAVVDCLVREAVEAARHFGAKQIVVAGGVAANQALRDDMVDAAAANGLTAYFPPKILCTDNAAMVAAAGHFQAGLQPPDDLSMEVYSALQLPAWRPRNIRSSAPTS